MTPVCCLTPSEITRELAGLIADTTPDERRVIHFAIWYTDPGDIFPDRLTDLVAALPDNEKAIQLPLIRRLHHGRKQYGGLHIDTDKRDFEASAVEEDIDAVAYRIVEALRGRKPKLLAQTFDTMRKSVEAGLKRGAL